MYLYLAAPQAKIQSHHHSCMSGQRQARLGHGGRVPGVEAGEVWPRYHTCLGATGLGAREPEAQELKLACCGPHSQLVGRSFEGRRGRWDEIFGKGRRASPECCPN